MLKITLLADSPTIFDYIYFFRFMLVLFSGLVVFMLLVIVHEYGHYLAAVLCKVGVVRFSVGFGPPLFRWKNKRGTDFQIAPIPLGGYVQMLEKQSQGQDDLEQPQGVKTFEQASYWQKLCIIAAGPLINFVCALLVFWFLQIGEKKELLSKIAYVEESSLASQLQLQTGDILLSIDGESIQSQSLFRQNQELFAKGKLLEIRRDSSSFQIPLPHYEAIAQDQQQRPIGIVFDVPVSLQVDTISAESSAEKMGIQEGDVIVSLNGQRMHNWLLFVKEIETLANQDVNIQVLREEILLNLQGKLGSKQLGGEIRGFLGIQPTRDMSDSLWISYNQNVLEAFWAACQQTFAILYLTVSSLGSLFEDTGNMNQLMGPVGISQVAAESVSLGLSSFLYFFAIVNIALGAINLVPLPMLDGGQILILSIEKIMGKPLHLKLHNFLRLFSIVIILFLTFVAFHNDFLRLLQ